MIYDDSEVAIINVEIDPQSLSWIFDSANFESDSMHLASVHFQNAYINEYIDSIGFRIRGNTSRNADKKSFKIDFNHFKRGRQFFDIEKINLNGEHNDPSLSRSKICWDIYEEIDIPSTRASHAELYINGEYYGLYVSIEHIDENFLERNFDDYSGNLWKCIWPADLTYRGDDPNSYHPYYSETRPYELKSNEDEYDFSQIARLIRMINQYPDSLETVLNVKQVLQYLAINILTGSWDDYRFLKNNFYLYHEPSKDMFHWIPFDYDNTFGVDWFGVDWSTIDPYEYANIDGTPRPLTEYIFQNEKYVNLFSHFLEFYAAKLINNANLDQRLDSIKTMIYNSVLQDTYYTYDYGFGIQDFENSFSYSFSNQHVKKGIKEFIQERSTSLLGQISYQVAEPYVYNVEQFDSIQLLNGELFLNASIFSNENINEVLFHYKTEDNDWNSSHFSPNPIGGSMQVEESDRWSVTIENSEVGQTYWYITAVSNGLVGRYPKYGYEHYAVVGIPNSGLMINEIMAINDTTISDNSGEYDDWIEIYNASDEVIFLQGYYFSDNKNDITKWQLAEPDINIYPDEKLILWCDNDEEQGVLHTNFKLSGSGEFISITAPNGITIIDSITFPSMEADLSYGRVQDGSLQWDFLVYPSPGQDNAILSLNNDWVVPNEIDIVSAYPNPFNSNISMKIKSNFAEQNQVHIYDIKGKVVFSDVVNSTDKGQVIWQWNGKGFNGMNVSTGTYIVRLSTDEGYSTKKISLIK